MLWAALLLVGIGRDRALASFRRLASAIYGLQVADKPHDITHTGLSLMARPVAEELVASIVSSEEAKDALAPLLLLEDFPAMDVWHTAIDRGPSTEGWTNMATAVAHVLDHQSQEATDCRWLRIISRAAAGKLGLAPEEMVDEIRLYPDFGDMRKVRPTIRAMEMGLRSMDLPEGEPERLWARRFWDQCFRDTPCFPLVGILDNSPPIAGTTLAQVQSVRSLLIQHARVSASTTSIDARYDAVFGFGLFALSLLEELLSVGTGQRIVGRLALRTLLEAYVTLAYLNHRNDADLWMTYRVYGAGQAKLSYLKLEEAVGTPHYVDLDTLTALANEDIWEEYLAIDLGHWKGSNLRGLSSLCGTTADYDKYYPWPSTFVHAQWGALRDIAFDYCGNPLHRLHRIPRDSPRSLPDVLPDACYLVDKVLDLVSTAFPGLPHRVTLAT